LDFFYSLIKTWSAKVPYTGSESSKNEQNADDYRKLINGRLSFFKTTAKGFTENYRDLMKD
jgi:hypothetical protein